jgi:hypothetical protein
VVAGTLVIDERPRRHPLPRGTRLARRASIEIHKIQRNDRLDGILHEYQQVA